MSCFPCPDGGVCEGKDALPYPKTGFWAIAETLSKQTKTIKVFDSKGASTMSTEPPYFAACGQDQCEGGKEFKCFPGYEGVMCDSCSKGQFYVRGFCDVRCSDIEPQGAVTIFGIIGVVIVWLVLNKSAGGLYECLDVGLGYAQIMSTVFTFDDQFTRHSQAYATIVSITNIVNLDVDYVSPSCLIPSGDWRWSYGYYILLAVPLIPFVVTGLLSFVAWAWCRSVKKRTWHGIHLGFMCNTPSQVEHFVLGYLKESIPFLGVVYNNVCLKAFAVFACKKLRDGTEILSVAPQVVCWESEHRQLVAVSIVALIIYVFGLPCVTLGTTLYAHHKDKLRDVRYLETVGLFYKEYEPEYYWWDAVFLARRFSLCLCAIVFQGKPFVQGVGRPFRYPHGSTAISAPSMCADHAAGP